MYVNCKDIFSLWMYNCGDNLSGLHGENEIIQPDSSPTG